MSGNGKCTDPKKWMIGHKINSSKIQQCFQQLDEFAHVEIGSARNVTTVSPRSLDIANRFDIVVKTVYALFLHSGKGTNATFAQRMYERHLEVCSQCSDDCTSAGDKVRFDAEEPCHKNRSGKNFRRSFSKLLKSISHDGFDNQKSLVPVTGAGFPLDGAHRISAAIALNLASMPVQHVTSTVVYNWDSAFFTSLGFEEKFSDFAMLQWTLHVRNVRTIIFWPATASEPEKFRHARPLVQHHCGDVMYEKAVNNGVLPRVSTSN